MPMSQFGEWKDYLAGLPSIQMHEKNSMLAGHLLVFWAMICNFAFLLTMGDRTMPVMGLGAGALALLCAHLGSGIAATRYSSIEAYTALYFGSAAFTIGSWLIFVITALDRRL